MAAADRPGLQTPACWFIVFPSCVKCSQKLQRDLLLEETDGMKWQRTRSQHCFFMGTAFQSSVCMWQGFRTQFKSRSKEPLYFSILSIKHPGTQLKKVTRGLVFRGETEAQKESACGFPFLQTEAEVRLELLPLLQLFTWKPQQSHLKNGDSNPYLWAEQ